jgi:hypothetical protein
MSLLYGPGAASAVIFSSSWVYDFHALAPTRHLGAAYVDHYAPQTGTPIA